MPSPPTGHYREIERPRQQRAATRRLAYYRQRRAAYRAAAGDPGAFRRIMATGS